MPNGNGGKLLGNFNILSFRRGAMTDKVDIKTQLTTFFEGLRSGVSCMKELRKSYDRKMAFDFNSLNFLRPGENKTSEILAFFLNPQAAHGQGDSFLKCFCSILLPKEVPRLVPEEYSTATVITEKSTDQNRRIDIVIKFPKEKIFIGIENKIWAEDQPDQLDHYTGYLEKESGGNYHLFYLTPYGHEPSQKSIKQKKYEDLVQDKKLSLLSYESDVISLLDGFIQVCMAENVQSFLREFQGYLKQQYKGEKVMDENGITRRVISEEKNWALALSVASQIDAVKNKIWEATSEQLQEWGKINKYEVKILVKEIQDMRPKWTSIVQISEGSTSSWCLETQFDSRNLNGLLWLVRGTVPSVSNDVLQQVLPTLDYEDLNSEHQQIWNRVSSPFDGNWGSDFRPWEAMLGEANSEGLNAFGEAVVEEYKQVKVVMDSILTKK
jgi:hypothetical protein